MRFEELVKTYDTEIQNGELFSNFDTLTYGIADSLQEARDEKKIVDYYSQNPAEMRDDLQRAWRIHNELDEHITDNLEIIEEWSPEDDVEVLVSDALECFITVDALKVGLGMSIKPVVESQINRYDIEPDDLNTFITPLKAPFRIDYYQDHYNFLQQFDNPEDIPYSAPTARYLIDFYSRGSKTLFGIRARSMIGDSPEFPDRDSRINKERKRSLEDRYGDIVWTVDRLLNIGNYTEDLYEYQLRGLGDYRMREIASKEVGVENFLEPPSLLEELRDVTSIESEEYYASFMEEYVRDTSDLLEKMGIMLDTTFMPREV